MAKKAKDKNPDDDRCGAKTKTGRPCRHPKGFRTDHPGSGRCYRHGGASPNGNKAAVREQMASLATEVDVEPQEVLLKRHPAGLGRCPVVRQHHRPARVHPGAGS